MHELETSLRERVHNLIVTHKTCEIRSTTGLNATVAELVQRTHALEQALIEIAGELDANRLSAREN